MQLALAVTLVLAGALHAPAEQRLRRQRQQRGLVRPEFEQAALALAAPGQAIEMVAVVVAQPREQRQVMRARQHVDGVDLQQAEAVDGASDMADVGRAVGARRAKALRGERDSTGGSGAGKRSCPLAKCGFRPLRHRQQRPIVQPRRHDLQADRQAVAACAAGDGDAGYQRQIEQRREHGMAARADFPVLDHLGIDLLDRPGDAGRGRRQKIIVLGEELRRRRARRRRRNGRPRPRRCRAPSGRARSGRRRCRRTGACPGRGARRKAARSRRHSRR